MMAEMDFKPWKRTRGSSSPGSDGGYFQEGTFEGLSRWTGGLRAPRAKRRGAMAKATAAALHTVPWRFPRFLRMESQRISMRWALCTRRSSDAVGQRRIVNLFAPSRDR